MARRTIKEMADEARHAHTPSHATKPQGSRSAIKKMQLLLEQNRQLKELAEKRLENAEGHAGIYRDSCEQPYREIMRIATEHWGRGEYKNVIEALDELPQILETARARTESSIRDAEPYAIFDPTGKGCETIWDARRFVDWRQYKDAERIVEEMIRRVKNSDAFFMYNRYCQGYGSTAKERRLMEAVYPVKERKGLKDIIDGLSKLLLSDYWLCIKLGHNIQKALLLIGDEKMIAAARLAKSMLDELVLLHNYREHGLDAVKGAKEKRMFLEMADVLLCAPNMLASLPSDMLKMVKERMHYVEEKQKP